MSVYGSQMLPMTAYPIGTTVTMTMDDEKGTRLEKHISDGESCVIVGLKDVPGVNVKDVSYDVCRWRDGRIVSCPGHSFQVDEVCYLLHNTKIAHDAMAIRCVTMSVPGYAIVRNGNLHDSRGPKNYASDLPALHVS
jgi:hypothetical protein